MTKSEQASAPYGKHAKLFSGRLRFSDRRITSIRDSLEKLPPLKSQTKLCVYVTGSIARGEASEHSDLDIFFIHDSQDKQNLPELDCILIKADIIRIARKLGFPEFSQDGGFLQIHHLWQMKELLGSPHDDYSNCFTARMLLLLESKPLFNADIYSMTVESLIGSYFRDFHEHRYGFVPLFLINDIQKYWRTMCLNYEHKRNRPSNDKRAKGKNHLKNLKLKFSRMLTCFSTVIPLSQPNIDYSERTVYELVMLRPLERLTNLANTMPIIKPQLEVVIAEYAWFLDALAKPADAAIDWILDRDDRIDAFGHADRFGDAMFAIIKLVTSDSPRLRHLVI